MFDGEDAVGTPVFLNHAFFYMGEAYYATACAAAMPQVSGPRIIYSKNIPIHRHGDFFICQYVLSYICLVLFQSRVLRAGRAGPR